ncbi:hypothetical protein HAZT_HAZT008766, partial [Hyalella azteca]
MWHEFDPFLPLQHLNRTYNSSVALVLMNSFNTDEDTQKVIRKYQGLNVKLYTFNQSRYPRINKESLMPIGRTMGTDTDLEAWYPPGHGDFYEAFSNSGLLQEFINQVTSRDCAVGREARSTCSCYTYVQGKEQVFMLHVCSCYTCVQGKEYVFMLHGKEYVFISNIDNLGATVDLNILNFLVGEEAQQQPPCEFLMEVTDKTRADVKGGTLIKYDNKLRLLEIAQVPKDHLEDFKSVKTFKIFNTNNLWIKLDAMARVVQNQSLDMEVIINHKTLDNGLNIIQLEQAVGAAVKSFNGAH